MTISHGNSTKRLHSLLPSKPSFDSENPSWIEDNDEDTIQPILTLDQT
jgi:hypothetical protein